MKRYRIAVALLFLFGSIPLIAQQSAEEVKVWKLEHSYWEYVKSGDLVSYRALWHSDFVGWPFVSAKPQRKDHITDWIANYAARGLNFSSYNLKPADSQQTGNLVVTYYWLTATWTDKEGHATTETSRITHSWIKVNDQWQIIGGMSTRVPMEPEPRP